MTEFISIRLEFERAGDSPRGSTGEKLGVVLKRQELLMEMLEVIYHKLNTIYWRG